MFYRNYYVQCSVRNMRVEGETFTNLYLKHARELFLVEWKVTSDHEKGVDISLCMTVDMDISKYSGYQGAYCCRLIHIIAFEKNELKYIHVLGCSRASIFFYIAAFCFSSFVITNNFTLLCVSYSLR